MVRLDGLLEAVALDEPHGVERPAVIVGAEAVDRHDPGVLQAAVDLGLQDEPAAEVGLGDLVGPDLLEGHLAAELLVAGDVDAAQPALAVEAEDAEPRAGAAGRGGVGRRRPGVAAGRLAASVRGGEAGLEVGVVEPLQVVADRAQRADGREARLGIAAVLLEVLGDQGLQQHAAGVVERPAIHQELGQGPGLVGDPGGEGGQQVVAADEVVLQGQDAEEEVAAGVRMRSRRRPVARPGPGPEGGADHPGVVREPVQVLLDPGRSPQPSPQLALQRHQLAQQRLAIGLVAPRPGSPRSAAPARPARRPRTGRTPHQLARTAAGARPPASRPDVCPFITIPPEATPRESPPACASPSARRSPSRSAISSRVYPSSRRSST